eukprot:1191963-Prorocentrum_minimum.AAC.10
MWGTLTLIYLYVFSQYTANALTDGQEITTIAFGSCSKPHLPQPLWDPIVELGPQVFVWLGDIVYADKKQRTWLENLWIWSGKGVISHYGSLRGQPGGTP